MSRPLTLAAYGVHVFTASGVVFGFLALLATIEGQKFLAFTYLGIALAIDGIDGTFARLLKVKERTPHMDGVTLDNVIDFFTYAIIPALMIWRWELAPEGLGVWLGAAILLASCYTYTNANMKTADGYFVGFPAIWNLTVLYLIIFGAGPWVCFGVLTVCVGLSFVPTTYVHPFRVRTLMALTIAITLVWALSVAYQTYWVLLHGHQASDAPLSLGLMLLASFYFAGISLGRWAGFWGNAA